MFIAKIEDKALINGGFRVNVTFTDGVTSQIETCTPQGDEGLKAWIKSRLLVYNSAAELDTKYSINDVVDVSEVVTPITQTQEEIDRNAWIKNYYKWLKVKTTLIDTGVLTGNETKVAQLKAKVTFDFLPAYLDFI